MENNDKHRASLKKSLVTKLIIPSFRGFEISAPVFIGVVALLNSALYHGPLFSFANSRLSMSSLGGIETLALLFALVTLMTAVALASAAFVSQRLLKPICTLGALANACALYFIQTYGVLFDKTMMGNVFNTNVAEAMALWHPKLLFYLIALGMGPCVALAWIHVRPVKRSRIAAFELLLLALAMACLYAASSSWLWIDKHARSVGGLILPWSYSINLARHQSSQWAASRQAALLPGASFVNDKKTVVVLVIGESSRARNYSLYGYSRQTNPNLSEAGVVPLANTRSCATYTTEALLCILSHDNPGMRLAGSMELLPSYMYRHGVDVVWRTNNWGEPPLNVGSYERASDLERNCHGSMCSHDDLLLTDLKHRILNSHARKVFVVLHLGGSHGPMYATKYPTSFEVFKPVCNSVELSECPQDSLVNAYDNSILYTDQVVGRAIAMLSDLTNMPSTLLYISDHGESLGEHGLYLHGTPMAIAPDVQKEVPFIVWMSPSFQKLHNVDSSRLLHRTAHTQSNVFHSVMGALGMRSSIYTPTLNIFHRTHPPMAGTEPDQTWSRLIFQGGDYSQC